MTGVGGSRLALALLVLAVLAASLAPPGLVASAQGVAVLVGPNPAPPVDLLVWLGGFNAYATVEAWLVGGGIPEVYLGSLQLGPSGEGLKVVGLPRDLPPGSYTIEFRVDGSTEAWVSIDVVQPQLSLSPSTASPGDVVTVEATGLGGGGVRYSYSLYIAGVQVGVLVPDENGNASASITAPALPSGVYQVELVYTPPMWLAQETVYGGPAVLAAASLEISGGVVTEGNLEELVASLVQEQIAPLEDRVTVLEGRVANLEDRVAALEDAVEQLDDAIVSLQQAVEDLDLRLSTAEQAIQDITRTLQDLDEGLCWVEGGVVGVGGGVGDEVYPFP